MPTVPNLPAAQPRPIPSFESMRIGGQPLPTSFTLALKQSWTQLYDLRDYLLNLFVDDEVPNGPQNGSNKTFTLANAPLPPQSLALYRNGQILVQGTDYNLIGKTITLAVAPFSTDTLIAFYRERLSTNQPSSQAIPPAPPTGGGGGSTGGLWTQNANFLYPTATFTECVLVGAQTSDFFGGAGQLGTTGTIGMMTAAINASLVYMFISPGVETQLVSNKSGTGVFLPLSFYTSNTRYVTLTTAGDFLVGFFTHQAGGGPGRIIASTFVMAASAATNASVILMQASVSGVENVLSSTHTGTGTDLPISFFTAATRAVTITTTQDLLCGFLTHQASGSAGRVIASVEFMVATASTNASVIVMNMSAGTEALFTSTHTGTGTSLPLSFYTSETRRVTIDTTGALFVGFFTTDLAPTSGMVIALSSFILINNTSNASVYNIHIGGSTISHTSSSTGTGPFLPMTWAMGGTEEFRLLTTGNLLGGITSTDVTLTSNTGAIVNVGGYSVVTASTNASALFLNITAGSRVNISSGATGTGTFLPMVFFVNSEAMRLTTALNLLVGLTSSDFPSHGLVGAASSIVTPQAVGVVTASTNAAALYLSYNPSVMFLVCDVTGTGTQRPMGFMMGATERARFDTTGAFLLGLTSTDVDAAGRMWAINLVGSITATVNASFIYMFAAAGSEGQLVSGHSGTGADLPMAFYTAGARQWIIDTGGILVGGGNASRGSYGIFAGRIVTPGDFICTSGFTANESFGRLILLSGVVTVQSGVIGTGTLLPLTFVVSGESARITNNGCWLFGITSTDDFTTNGKIVSGVTIDIVSATANASIMDFSISGGVCQIVTTHTGTGSDLPLALRPGAGSSRVFVLRTTDDGSGAVLQVAGNISVNGTVLTVP